MESKKRNIRLPAEWEPQDAVMLIWPHPHTDWQPLLHEVIPCYVKLANEILREEKLVIVCASAADVKAALGRQTNPPRILFREIASNDTWARDCGPISVFIDGQPAILDFGFNGWGLKFPAHFDNQITRQLYKSRLFDPRVEYYPLKNKILEGGSIESDGAGTILTTAQCLTAPNRNQYRNAGHAARRLATHLGRQRFLWLHHGRLSGDDTDGHIDTLARFCDPETIAYQRCTNPEDEHFAELLQMERELQSFRTLAGKPYRLIPLPMPDAICHNGERLPATYANFLIINNSVLTPIYNQASDSVAIAALQTAFPGRKIIGVDCTPLIKQHGSLHCITMHIPQGFISPKE
jgi:agmatine/peptidylarginine deiminase